MPDSIFSKLGRALSIFGVSSPEDIRKMQRSGTVTHPPPGDLSATEDICKANDPGYSRPSPHQTSTKREVG